MNVSIPLEGIINPFVSRRHEDVKVVVNLRFSYKMILAQKEVMIKALLAKLLVVREAARQFLASLKRFVLVPDVFGEVRPAHPMPQYYRTLRNRLWKAKKNGIVLPVDPTFGGFLTAPNEPVLAAPVPAPEVEIKPIPLYVKYSNPIDFVERPTNRGEVFAEKVHAYGKSWWTETDQLAKYYAMASCHHLPKKVALSVIHIPADYLMVEAAIKALDEIMSERETKINSLPGNHWYRYGNTKAFWIRSISKYNLNEFDAECFMGKAAYEFESGRDCLNAFETAYAPFKTAKDKREIEASTAALKAKREAVYA